MKTKHPHQLSEKTATLLDLANRQDIPKFALFEKAFRPFFLGAVLFSLLHLTLWIFVWAGHWMPALPPALSPFLWHGHEMVFGYGYAIVSGFLLTAVSNWTGHATPIRKPLVAMLCLWLVARACFLFGSTHQALWWLSFGAETLLMLSVAYAFARPVIATKNRRQFGFVSKLFLLAGSNALFYAGMLGIISAGDRYGVYLGAYLIVAVVLAMGRRVVPFFIKNALQLPNDLYNSRVIEISGVILFVVFTTWDVFFPHNNGLAWVSLALFAIYAIQLGFWFSPRIFRYPLLWSLWLAMAITTVGFLLKSLTIWLGLNPFLALHAFTLGGIGLMTLGMMSRVSLGHTGRNVFAPSKALLPIFILMLGAVIARVFLPLFFTDNYKIFIMVSVTFWLLSFIGFLIIYTKPLLTARLDGKAG